LDPAVTLQPGTLVPRRLPDLFAGSPCTLSGRYQGGLSQLVLRGRDSQGNPWMQQIEAHLVQNPAIRAIWARGQVRELEDQMIQQPQPQVEQQLISTSLSFQVLCRYTAYLAVDAEGGIVSPGGKGQHIVQPVESPYPRGQSTTSNSPITAVKTSRYTSRTTMDPKLRSYSKSVSFIRSLMKASQLTRDKSQSSLSTARQFSPMELLERMVLLEKIDLIRHLWGGWSAPRDQSSHLFWQLWDLFSALKQQEVFNLIQELINILPSILVDQNASMDDKLAYVKDLSPEARDEYSEKITRIFQLIIASTQVQNRPQEKSHRKQRPFWKFW
jgi:hypothetical protein